MSCCRRRAEKRAAAAGDLEAGALEPAPAKPRKLHLGQLYRGAPILDRVVLVIGVLSAAAHGAMTPSFAILMAEGIRVTATATQANVGAAIGTVVSIMLFITTASLILGFLWTTAFFWFAGRQVARLRTEYFNCVLTRDLGWFDQNQPAALPARMVTETKAIHEALGTRSGEIVVYFSQFVFALAAAFARGWELTLVICGVIPVILGVGHLMTHKMKAATKEEDAWLAKAGAVTEESLLGIRTVVAFGAERREESRLHAELQGARRGGLRASLATGLSFGFLLLFLSCSFALAFWYGSHQMIARGGRSQVDVIIVVIVVVIGVSSVTNIEGPADIFVKATSAAASMCSVLDAPSQIEGSGEAGKEGPMEVTTVETIEFRDVYFSYPSRADVPILDGLNLSIAKGQKVAMVGASGSGKSTVVQLLERFYDPVSGGVFVNGVALQRLPVYGWRRLIGYVGQEPVLFQCSVTDNIRGGDPTMSDEVVAEAAKQAEAFDFVTSLPGGFQTWVGVGGGQMSGGQKQRIAIARALAKMPQVLILDEATSALDNESEKQVQATLDQLQSSACRGLTTISVAHRLSTVRNADAIFVLKNGKVVEQGTHADLIERRAEYFSLVEAQRTAQDEEGGDGSDDEDAEEAACAEDAGVVDGCPTPQSCLRSLSDHRDFSQVFSAASSPATHKSGEQPPEHPAVADHRCMRRLIGLTRPEWALYPFGIVASLITGANLPVQGLLLSKGITSLYIQPTDRMLASVDAWSLGLVLLGVATLVGEAAKHSFFGYIQRCLTTRVRVMAFGSLLRQEIGLFDDPAANIPSVSSGIARAAQDIAMMTGIGIGNTVQALFGVVAGLALAFAATWKLTLVVIALIPLVAASMIIVSVVLTDPFDSEAHTMADAVTATAVLNIRTVRSFVAEKSFSYLFSQAISQIARAEASAAPKKGLALAINSAVIFLVYLVGMWYGAQLISSDGLDPASVYQALICVTLGFSGAGLAASYGPIIRHGRRSAMALFGVVDRQSKINAEATCGKHQDAGDGTVEFRNVTFRFPHRAEQRVLKHMSLKVQKGQTVALVGPSGGGKSTIVQLLLRYYDPSHGAVKVGNMDLRCFDLVWWRRQVGLVGQEPVLFDVSLEDNIKYGYPEATREEVEAAAREANMDYAFNGTIAWEDRLGIRGERLSGGQKQRCAIARAIVRRPQLLLLDEATSALDSASEQVVQVALDNVRKGRTTFTIAHRLSTIKDSDVILVVSSGHIVERGTHEELLARRGWYAQMAPQ